MNQQWTNQWRLVLPPYWRWTILLLLGSSVGAVNIVDVLGPAGALRQAGRVRSDAATLERLRQAVDSFDIYLLRGAAAGLAGWDRPAEAIVLLSRLDRSLSAPRWRSRMAQSTRALTRTAWAYQEARQVGLHRLDSAVSTYLRRCGTNSRSMVARIRESAGYTDTVTPEALYLQGLAKILAKARRSGIDERLVQRHESATDFVPVYAATLHLELSHLTPTGRRDRILRRLRQAATDGDNRNCDAQALADEAGAAVVPTLCEALREFEGQAETSLPRITLVLVALAAIGDSSALPAVERFVSHPNRFVRGRARLTIRALRSGRPLPAKIDFL